jgi:hypothetical protein
MTYKKIGANISELLKTTVICRVRFHTYFFSLLEHFNLAQD